VSLDERPDRPVEGDAPTHRRRRWLRVLGWLVAVAVWVVVCFTWLFPWLVDTGFDPTLGV
jgi:hypothetical protein